MDMLQQLGDLLQRERNLSQQMHGETSCNRQGAVCIDVKWHRASRFYATFAVFRRQIDDLQGRKMCISNEERLLAAKIMEVKQTLAEVKNRNTAGKGRKWMSICRVKQKLTSSLNNSIFVCQQHKRWSKHQVNQRESRGHPSEWKLSKTHCDLKYLEYLFLFTCDLIKCFYAVFFFLKCFCF